MLKNGNTVIRNGNNITKSLVVNSYLETNDRVIYYIETEGLSENNPLKIYVDDGDILDKKIFTTDILYNQLISYNSYVDVNKNIYVFGNVDSVKKLRIYLNYSNRPYRGDIKEFLNLFKNLQEFEMYIQTSYNTSLFDQDLTHYKLPINLKVLKFYDSVIRGNIEYIENFDNLETINFRNTKFSGSLNNVNFKNLKSFTFYNNTELLGDIDIISSNLEYINITYPSKLIGNLTNLNTSNLNYIHLDINSSSNTNNIIGDITDWDFNTGLTYFYYNNTSSTNNQIYGDLSNWDISNTQLSSFNFDGYSSTLYISQIYGDLSQWELPDTLNTFNLRYGDITDIPYDFSNTVLNNLTVNHTQITSINNVIFPDKQISTVNLRYNNIVSISGVTFPNISNFYLEYQQSMVDDINDINFSSITTINMSHNRLHGNIHDFVIPENTDQIYFQSNKDITGYISGITFNDHIRYLYLNDNMIYGSIVGMVLPDSLNNTLNLSDNDIYIDFDEGEFFTNQLYYLYLNNISGITGDLSNFIIGDRLNRLDLHTIQDSYTDLSKLNIGTGIRNLYIHNTNFYGDLTNWLTGTTINITSTLILHTNPNISGDTSNWNIAPQTCYLYNSPQLTGRLKHNNIYDLRINGTSTIPMNITSNIVEDFNLSNRLYYFHGQFGSLTGNLSGVTLNTSFYQFYVNDNPDIYGSNEFIDYIFINRNVFTSISWSNICYINIANIGDTVSGSTEELGDLGTYTGSEWDLSETQVNNLSNGLDYDGNGNNIEWNPKQKIYWFKNAQISSTNTSKRYITYSITY